MIDNLRREIFEGSGNAQEKLKRLFNKELSYNNAALYLAGMKLYATTVKDVADYILSEDDEDFESNKTVIFNADHSETIEQDIYLEPGEVANTTTVMKKFNLDPLEWEVKRCKIISGGWDTTMKLVNSEIVDGKVLKTSTPLKKRNRKYHIELTVHPLVSQLKFSQVLDAFKVLSPVKSLEYDYKDISSTDALLYELPIVDFHFGKHAWREESGDDYDLKIAEKLWCKSIVDLNEKAQRFGQIEAILFPIGQDFFHFDTPGVTTTSGTQLNSDSRWEKVFRKGVDVLVWGVEKLREIAPVEVLWVPGNHDQMLSYAATVGLAQRYSETESVQVDLISTPRKYRLFGKNLIGYSHGEKEGKRLDGLMQIEAPGLWGKSMFREFHMGHLHSEMAETKNGIKFRRISAITGTDAWHAEHGFIGATRQAQAFLWHKTLGLQAILNSNVMEKF